MGRVVIKAEKHSLTDTLAKLAEQRPSSMHNAKADRHFSYRENKVQKTFSTMALALILAVPADCVAQPTLLDSLFKSILPRGAGAKSTAAHGSPPGTAWLKDVPNVSDITLGMSPTDVMNAMTAKPLKLIGTDKLPSRTDRIKAAVDNRLGNSTAATRGNPATEEVARLKFASSDRQGLTVVFGDGPAGRVVTSVRNHIDAASITRDRFKAQLEAKYGPIAIGFDSGAYCTVGDNGCDWMGQTNKLPAVAIDWAINAYNITLSEGSQRKTERLAPIDAEIKRQAPQTAAEARTTSF